MEGFPVTEQGGDIGQWTVLRGKVVQQLALKRCMQQGLVFMLTVDIDQLFAQFTQ